MCHICSCIVFVARCRIANVCALCLVPCYACMMACVTSAAELLHQTDPARLVHPVLFVAGHDVSAAITAEFPLQAEDRSRVCPCEGDRGKASFRYSSHIGLSLIVSWEQPFVSLCCCQLANRCCVVFLVVKPAHGLQLLALFAWQYVCQVCSGLVVLRGS